MTAAIASESPPVPSPQQNGEGTEGTPNQSLTAASSNVMGWMEEMEKTTVNEQERNNRIIEKLDNIMRLLTESRNSVKNGDTEPVSALKNLKQSVKENMEQFMREEKDAQIQLGNWGKSIDKSFRTGIDKLQIVDKFECHGPLVNEIIAMDFQRRGRWSLYDRFVHECGYTGHALQSFEAKLVENAGTSRFEKSRRESREMTMDMDQTHGQDPPTTDMRRDMEVLPHANPALSYPTPSIYVPFSSGVPLSSIAHIRAFEEMNKIVDCIRRYDLAPAIEWARIHQEDLEQRHSPLTFRLHRLHFLWLLFDHEQSTESQQNTTHMVTLSLSAEENNLPEPTMTESLSTTDEGKRQPTANASVLSSRDSREDRRLPSISTSSSSVSLRNVLSTRVAGAIAYARIHFALLARNHMHEIQRLMGCLVYAHRLEKSPYAALYTIGAWLDVESLFIREYCTQMGLAVESPLHVATLVGAYALPVLMKMHAVMQATCNEWSQKDELPVEIPLPRECRYHSIFICPVSKEQGREENPPMMLPCGHVILKDSLVKLAKGNVNQKFKCPYCPIESTSGQARRIYF